MVENLAEKDDKLDTCEAILDEEINVEAEDNNNRFVNESNREREETDEMNKTQNQSENLNLCMEASQHKCRICEKYVCNLFSSIQDPNSENEIHCIHKPGEILCSTNHNF